MAPTPKRFFQEDIFSILSDSVFQSEAGLVGALLAFSESGHWFENNSAWPVQVDASSFGIAWTFEPASYNEAGFFLFRCGSVLSDIGDWVMILIWCTQEVLFSTARVGNWMRLRQCLSS
jgi:hypothetical protein